MPNEHDVFLQSISQPSGISDSIYNRRDLIEPYMNEQTKEPKDRFWYQDLILRAIQNNDLEKGCLFYHGMGTGKTCLYSKYIRNSILNHRYFRNIYIVVSKKLSKNVEKELYSENCGLESLKNNPSLSILTYRQFQKLKLILFNDLVIIDEAHQILESNANLITGDNVDDFIGAKSEKKHDMYEYILFKANQSINSVFLLFDGTPIQNHEVDLVNLVRLTSKDLNAYVVEKSGLEEYEFMNATMFDKIFNTQENIEELVKWIGKQMSFLQIPNEIPRNFKSNKKFHIKKEGTVIFSHTDMRKFGNLYLSEMSKAHVESYKTNVSSMNNTDRNVLARKALSLKDDGVVHGEDSDSMELDLSRIQSESSGVTGLTGLRLFMNELVYNRDGFLKQLTREESFANKMRIVKEHSPIIWSILVNICGVEHDSEESGTCMVYSQYKTGIFDDNGLLRAIMRIFGFVNFKAVQNDNDKYPYKRFLYLENPADFNFLDSHVNISENVMGKLVRVLFLSPMASEGFSIYNCQQVHILCPDHGLFFKTDQAISRGVRLGRHDELIKLFESKGQIFDKVDVFLHAGIFNDATHFPYNLGYYIKMYFDDVRIKAFERMCIQESIDCRFLKVMNENSPENNGIRTCNYLSCNIYCNEKVPENLKLNQKHLVNSFYDFNRTNIDIVKAWVKDKLWKDKYICIDYEQYVLSQHTRPENLLVFQNTLQTVIKYWDGQQIRIGANQYVVHYLLDIDCLVLLPNSCTGIIENYSFVSKYIHSSTNTIFKSILESNNKSYPSKPTNNVTTTVSSKKSTKVSTYSKRLEYELPLPFSWNTIVKFFKKLHKALLVMSESDEITSTNSWWYLVMTTETPTIPASLKIKIMDKQKILEMKMGGVDRFVTDIYTYIIKKCMVRSVCTITDDSHNIKSWIVENLPTKAQSVENFTDNVTFKDFSDLSIEEWHTLIVQICNIYMEMYFELPIMKTICDDVSTKIQRSDITNSEKTGKINKLAALQNILHFLSIGSNGQSSANTTAAKTDKLEVIPEPLRAMMATLVCDFSDFADVFTDTGYFKKLLLHVNTNMIQYHLSFIPKEYMYSVLNNLAQLILAENVESVTYNSIKELFTNTTNPPSTKLTHNKTNKIDVTVSYIEALDDLFLNYVLLYRYYKQQVLSTVLGTVCQNKTHIKESSIDFSSFPEIKKCSQLWTHLLKTDDARAIYQDDFPHFKLDKD